MAVSDFKTTIGNRIYSNLQTTTLEKYVDHPEYANNVDNDYTNAIGDAVEVFLEGGIDIDLSSPLWTIEQDPIQNETFLDIQGNHSVNVLLYWQSYSNASETEEAQDATLTLDQWLLFRSKQKEDGSWPELTLYDALPSSVTEYIDFGAVFNSSYRYQLRGVDTVGNISPASTIQETTTPDAPMALQPTDKIQTGIGVREIALEYSGVIMPNLIYYQIEYRWADADSDGEGGYTVPVTPVWSDWSIAGRVNATTYDHEKLEPYYCYQYRYASVNSYNVVSEYNSSADSALLSDIVIPLSIDDRDEVFGNTFKREIRKDLDSQDADGRLEFFITYDSQNPKYMQEFGWDDTDNSLHNRDYWFSLNNLNTFRYNGTNNSWEQIETILDKDFYKDNILHPTDLTEVLHQLDLIIKEKTLLTKSLNQLSSSSDTKSNFFVAFNRLYDYLYHPISGKLINLNRVSWAEYVAGPTAINDGSISVFIQSTTPTADGFGDIWVNTSSDEVLTWVTTSSWEVIERDNIATSLFDFIDDNTGDNKIVLYYQSVAPIANVNDYWTDTSSGILYQYDGSEWIEIDDWNISINSPTFEDKFRTFYYQKQQVLIALSGLSYSYNSVRYRNNDAIFNLSADTVDGEFLYDYILSFGRGYVRFYTTSSLDVGSLSTMENGDLAFTTDTEQKYQYNGSDWVELDSETYQWFKAFYIEDGLRRLYANKTDTDIPSTYEVGDMLFSKYTTENNDGITTKTFSNGLCYIANTNSTGGFDNRHWQVAITFTNSQERLLKINVYDHAPESTSEYYFTGDFIIPENDFVFNSVSYLSENVYSASIPDEENHRLNDCPMINDYWTTVIIFTDELRFQGADNTLTPTEKNSTFNEWRAIEEEYEDLIAEAESYLIDTDAYDTAYNDLENYLFGSEGILNDTNIVTYIQGSEYETKFDSYYREAKSLRKLVSLSAQVVAPSTDFQFHLAFDEKQIDSESGEDIVADITGNGFDGKLNGTYNLVPGVSGKGIEFTTAQDGYVEITEGANVSLTNTFTVTGWIKASNFYSGGNGIVLGSNDATSEGFKIQFTDNDFYFDTYHSGVKKSSWINNLDMDTWFFFTAIFDNGVKEIYLNTIKFSQTIVLENSIDSFTSAFYVNADNGHRFEGIVDEIRVYNKRLSEAEIRYLYRSPSDGTNTNLSVAKTLKGLNVDGEVINIIKGPNLPSYTPDESGLYTTNEHIGFYDITTGEWRVNIDKFGDFLFKGDGDNYIAWNGSTLQIKGSIAGAGVSGVLSFDDVYNYWNLDTGDFKIGNNESYFSFNAEQNTLRMKLDSFLVSSLQTLVKGDLKVSYDADLNADFPIITNPIVITTEKNLNPSYGVVSHINTLKLSIGNTPRLTINNTGRVLIDGNLNVSESVKVQNKKDFVNAEYLHVNALSFPHYSQAHWPMEKGTGDSIVDTKQGQNGTITGANWSTDGSMRFLQFAGSDYVNLPTTYSYTGDFTMYFRIKPDDESELAVLNSTESEQYSFTIKNR